MTKPNKQKVDFSLCWPSITFWMWELPWTVVKKLSEPYWKKNDFSFTSRCQLQIVADSFFISGKIYPSYDY